MHSITSLLILFTISSSSLAASIPSAPHDLIVTKSTGTVTTLYHNVTVTPEMTLFSRNTAAATKPKVWKCKIDEHCDFGYICGKKQTCEIGCRSDHQCIDGQTCEEGKCHTGEGRKCTALGRMCWRNEICCSGYCWKAFYVWTRCQPAWRANELRALSEEEQVREVEGNPNPKEEG